ncbi:hypothetical protein HMPREF0201_00145 [Cedecea davisae DSM 4568]|uniref:Uncharacterized protein n=1 Tax=Cedecea davisae DSM 4568 TaxID=566551 RepID=S3K5R7_9ENTR|nr:hypothetical protein HMPREF0201_00145 [Cedecea davisae DSM 4568]
MCDLKRIVFNKQRNKAVTFQLLRAHQATFIGKNGGVVTDRKPHDAFLSICLKKLKICTYRQNMSMPSTYFDDMFKKWGKMYMLP